jgi:hypothetical protein
MTEKSCHGRQNVMLVVRNQWIFGRENPKESRISGETGFSSIQKSAGKF